MPGRVAIRPWITELARTLPGAVQTFLPGSSVDRRSREQLAIEVATAAGCRPSQWIHTAWRDFLGSDAAPPVDDEALDYARSAGATGLPPDPAALAGSHDERTVVAIRATVARTQLENFVAQRPMVALAALPLTAPVAATAALMRLVTRAAPPPVPVEAPDPDTANLLTHLLAKSFDVWLANAAVRFAVLRIPVPLAVGLRTGRSATTVRLGGGRVRVENEIAGDVVMVLEGEIEPLLRLATGAILRDVRSIRIRPK